MEPPLKIIRLGKQDDAAICQDPIPRSQASDMVFASFPMICSVVRSLKTAGCRETTEKELLFADLLKPKHGRSEYTCRLHMRESQRFTSREFNVFIDLFVGQIYFWAFGNDEGEPHSFGPWALAAQELAPDTRTYQLPDGAALRRSLFFQLPVKGRRDIHRSANRILFHKAIIRRTPKRSQKRIGFHEDNFGVEEGGRLIVD